VGRTVIRSQCVAPAAVGCNMPATAWNAVSLSRPPHPLTGAAAIQAVGEPEVRVP